MQGAESDLARLAGWSMSSVLRFTLKVACDTVCSLTPEGRTGPGRAGAGRGQRADGATSPAAPPSLSCSPPPVHPPPPRESHIAYLVVSSDGPGATSFEAASTIRKHPPP